MWETEGDRNRKTNERGREQEELSDDLWKREQIERTEETCNTFLI